MKQQKSKKVRAILAGGLVLGVGAAVTLAAWNDSEFAKETFTAGSFNLQGSATGEEGSYTDHADTSGALELDFSFTNLTPNDIAYAPYWLRLDAASTTDGELIPAGVKVPGTPENVALTNADAISYSIIQVESGDCKAGTAQGTEVAAGPNLTSQDVANKMLLSADETDPGSVVHLCIKVTAGAQATAVGEEGKFEQSKVTTATWEFKALSDGAS